ncbi:MAG: hypothetical protein ACOZCO_14320 [Bacteroidota bacterium]
MFKNINLLDELEKERERLLQEKLLAQAKDILEQDARGEKEIIDTIKGNKPGFSINPVFENEKLFSLEEIKNTCIRYRMRFLDSELYKGNIPQEAVFKIRELQKKSETRLEKFKIMAPERLFRLADADADPMLFAETTGGKFYLIHKWGTDMKWYRRALAFPSQSLQNLVITLIAISALVALITPNGWIVPESNMAVNNVFGYWGLHRITFFFHFLILIGGFTIFFRFSFFRGLSDSDWDKKTFN